MAQEAAQNGQDIALAALVGAAQTAALTWVVPCVSNPGAAVDDRDVSAAEVFAARFTGAAPVSLASTDFANASGASPGLRQRVNLNPKTTAAVTGLGGAVDVTHYALVRTSDGLVPNSGTSYANINQVVARGALDETKTGVTNGDTITFPVGSIKIRVN